jgi:transcriptional regulator with XRE-family HTH domain
MELVELGKRLQQLRSERGLTLQDLAGLASVSVSMLSSIERGQKAPTIVLLGRIADGLGVSLSSLVAGVQDNTVIVRRAADQDVVEEPGGWRRTILTPVIPGVNFEWVKSTLPPGCEPSRYPAYAPGSHEYVVVDSGRLRLTIGEQEYDLDAGDSVYFAADVSHEYSNPGDTACTYYVAALIMRSRLPRHNE